MKKKTLVLSVGYWFSAYTLGLLLHPYKTVRELRRNSRFTPMVAVPVVIWSIVWVVGMVGLRFGWVVLWVLGLKALPRFITLLAFLFWWFTFFMGMWQVLLLYLWLRFGGVNQDNE